jgi:hypothetical protein
MPTLTELLQNKSTLPTQPGNPVPLTNAPYNKPFGINPIGEIVKKLVGEKGLQREEADLVQIGNFVKRIPQIYGIDTIRIVTQTDPHKAKVLIKKSAGAIAGALGGAFGGSVIGKLAGRGINAIADFNPKFPDDFLEGDDTHKDNSGLTFDRYSDLYKSDYANGKYYNGGITNNKSKLGAFLNGIKTPSQLKDQLLGKAKSLAIGLAITGLSSLAKKLFKKNTGGQDKTKPEVQQNSNSEKYSALQLPSGYDGKLEYKRTSPIFPSINALYTTKNYNSKAYVIQDSDTLAINQNAINVDGSGIGVKSSFTKNSTVTSQKRIEDATKLNSYNLNSLYSNFLERSIKKNKDSDVYSIGGPQNYYGSLFRQNDSDEYKREGIYSKDVLRIFDITNPTEWEAFPTIQDFEQANPQWDNLIYSFPTLKYGAGLYGTSSADISPIPNRDDDFNHTIEYTHSNLKPNIVRYNMSSSIASSNINKILENDTAAASGSLQSQNNEIKNKASNINPYIINKIDILNNVPDKYDRIKFKIADNILLATLTGISDNTTPTWTDVKSVGSGFKFYLYDSWEREISFKFQMYAENKEQLNRIWDKAEKIKQLTLPSNKGNKGVFGRVIPLKIGDLINVPYGFLTACNTTILDTSPWEIDDTFQKPFVYEMDITYKVVSNDKEYKHYN